MADSLRTQADMYSDREFMERCTAAMESQRKYDANAITLFSDGSRLILEEAKGKSLTDERGELVDALTNVVESLNRSSKGTEETAIILVKLEEARQWLRQMGKI